VTVIVEVRSELGQPEHRVQVSLEIDTEAVDERQFMSVKGKQNLVLGYDVKESSRHGFRTTS
jgi:hypothetical protein